MTQDDFLMAYIIGPEDSEPDTVGVLIERRGNSVTLAFPYEERELRLTFERLELLHRVEGSLHGGGD
jgi:hypothetical protein